MPDDAGRDAAFYDHEKEPRRHVADWGADDLFAHAPRRRELRAASQPRLRGPAPRNPVHRSTAPEATGRFRRDASQDGEHRHSPVEMPRRFDDEEPVARPGSRPAAQGSYRDSSAPALGRRTVVIQGRPEGHARALAARRRPPRTVAERVGPRPERIVAWACLLGFLLILIAVATSDAATL